MHGLIASAVEVTNISRHGFWLLLDEEDADRAADSSPKGKQAAFPKGGKEPPAQRFVTSEPRVPVWFDQVSLTIEMFKLLL